MSGDTKESNEESSAREHLEDIDDDCGCVEVWERLSERRSDEE